MTVLYYGPVAFITKLNFCIVLYIVFNEIALNADFLRCIR